MTPSINSITLPANAKLNLTLNITGKREDGYHNIVSEMQEIDLADIVTVRLTGDDNIRIICDNPEIPTNNRNIAYRAAELFVVGRGDPDAPFSGVEITIQKRIPIMAGLGGSSTDGAAVLKALNQLNGNPFNQTELCEMGAKLGADVPFCMTGGRAECRGIGDIITPLPDLPTQYYAIIQPNFHCDTKKAYELYDVGHGDPDAPNTTNIFQQIYNDPRIDKLCAELMESGAKSASMTGSGSAVFGVFDNEESAKAALHKLDYPFKHIACNVLIDKG